VSTYTKKRRLRPKKTLTQEQRDLFDLARQVLNMEGEVRQATTAMAATGGVIERLAMRVTKLEARTGRDTWDNGYAEGVAAERKRLKDLLNGKANA
jgi:hypothetical protein